jgi:hypothetical protein
LGEQNGNRGNYNNGRPFLPGASVELNFLHPDFLQGDEVREFITLLTDLSGSEDWVNISAYLYERYPINLADLRDAREQFAPELFLPAELRPLYKHIPDDADASELNYLTEKLRALGDSQRKVFNAVIEAGWHCVSVAEIINLTENLHNFDLEPTFNEAQYGAFRLANDWDICEMSIRRLEKSEDIGDRFLVKYISLLVKCAEDEAYGYNAAKDDGGKFTKYGYISQGEALEDIYRGKQDIPSEYLIPAPPTSAIENARAKEPLIMLQNTDLAALLLEMHAVSGDYMRDAKHNIRTLVNGGDDLFVMVNANMLTVTPIDFMYRRDMFENEHFMTMSPAPDNRAFIMEVLERDDRHIIGNLYETDFWAMRDSICEHGFYFTHNRIHDRRRERPLPQSKRRERERERRIENRRARVFSANTDSFTRTFPDARTAAEL